MVDEAAIDEAVAALAAGALVVYPTETVYGLGADAADDGAIERAASAKGRGGDKAISVLVASLDMVEQVAASFPASARRLAERFWPGPLTLVLPARPGLSPRLTAGGGTIGVRISSHPVARALVEALGRPLTTTSANLAGEPAATTVGEARRALGAAVAVYLDGGPCRGSAASTVVDCTAAAPRVLRAGAIAAADIAAAERAHPS